MDLKLRSTQFRIFWIFMFQLLWIDPYSASGTWDNDYHHKESQIYCPKSCICIQYNVDCTGKNLTKIPENLSEGTRSLDLSSNKIASLPENAFSKLQHLEELRLAGNLLSKIPDSTFHGLTRLRTLKLQGNHFKEVPEKAFENLIGLRELFLDANEIQNISEYSFQNMRRLKQLRLDANFLSEIPVNALRHVRSLEALELSTNKITHIPNFAFRNLSNLIVLMLHDDKISHIADHAFEGLQVLEVLELHANRLKHIPVALTSLPDLRELNIEDNLIEYIPNHSFQRNKKLMLLKLRGNPLTDVDKNAFQGLPHLTDLILSEVKNMEEFPDLTGTYSLTKIRFDRASIQSIPDDLCLNVVNLETLDMHSNRIKRVPDLSHCKTLKILNLGNNEISSLEGSLFMNVTELRDLTLSHNRIAMITADSFIGLNKLEYLDLSHNKITEIKDNAFLPLHSLMDLNLGENDFPRLPTEGLKKLQKLKTFHNKKLQARIPASHLPNIQTLVLAYAYHCCDFLQNPKKNVGNKVEVSEQVTWLQGSNDLSFWNNSLMKREGFMNMTDPDSISTEVINELNEPDENYYPLDAKFPTYDYDHPDYDEHVPPQHDVVQSIAPVHCEPLPGPFLPCDDLFGWWSLRCGVWMVFLLAVLGNGIVLFVSISCRSKMDVPRFMICNLACADFCMGVYLGILAVVDASTLGEFQIHAIKWQTSPGCLVAGFLGIVSSELSVFTLTVITLERFYAIKHAMQFNKRLSLKHAGYIMFGGWLFCLTLASLPLFEISDFRKFAICLPFETGDKVSLAYVCFIMFFNAISFVIIVGCYTKMYMSIILGYQSWNSKDFRVAKRMALLVFTDFLCWAPIIFFSVTAALGKDLIGLNEAKVLTIFVLSLNSCANPFLYAIFTKQFKKDCVKLCKRIEESSLSRSLTNTTGRRVSLGFGSWRTSHLQSPFHTEKRGSCSNSVSASSSIVGVVNQTEDGVCQYYDASAYIKKDLLEKDSENEGSEEKACFQEANMTHLNHSLLQQSECECSQSKTRKLSVGPVGSDTQIVIHFDKKGNSLSSERKTDELKYIRCKKCHKKVKKTSANGINKYSNVFDDPSSKPKESFTNCSRIDDQIQNIDDQTLNDNDHKTLINKQCLTNASRRNANNPVTKERPSKEISPKEKRELLKLPKGIEKRDKTMHINEWRKSSHLSCLWRNSLDLETHMPKYKSNSLADLPRSPIGFSGSPGKRRSLTSRHEGYLLRKNSNRDSAYEDEEEMLEYQDCKSLSADQCRHLSVKQFAENGEHFGKAHALKRQERVDSQGADYDEKLDLLGATKVTPQYCKRGSDKESGISSDNLFLGD